VIFDGANRLRRCRRASWSGRCNRLRFTSKAGIPALSVWWCPIQDYNFSPSYLRPDTHLFIFNSLGSSWICETAFSWCPLMAVLYINATELNMCDVVRNKFRSRDGKIPPKKSDQHIFYSSERFLPIWILGDVGLLRPVAVVPLQLYADRWRCRSSFGCRTCNQRLITKLEEGDWACASNSSFYLFK
jgi:hypothetical protein